MGWNSTTTIFYKNGFGIKYHTRVDMPLKKKLKSLNDDFGLPFGRKHFDIIFYKTETRNFNFLEGPE